MFRNKHIYTCPDSIHDHQVAKRRNRIGLAFTGLFYGSLFTYGWFLNRKEEKQLEKEAILDPAE